MPSTTRPEVNDPNAYRSRILALVAGRDPLDILAQTPDRFAALIASNPPETLRARPYAGKWTPLEVMGHLLDGEWTYGYRSRTILCDETPEIIGMDQDRWVACQQHNQRDPADLLDEFRTLRRSNLRLWRNAGAQERERFGLHRERGEESLGLIIELLAGHDLWHLQQIDRYLKAIGEGLRNSG